MNKPLTATDLTNALWPEAFQTEESAKTHCAREARRLGSSPPAVAMRAVSQHAGRSLVTLEKLARERGHKGSKLGKLIGQSFSLARTFGADLVLSKEKSYRGTLLGIHHSIGVFALLEDAATASGDQALADFCAEWLTERRSLCTAAEDALAWFAEHPAIAAERAIAKLGDHESSSAVASVA